MTACFQSSLHEQRMCSKIDDDPDFLKELELVDRYETLGKLASRTYLAQKWLGEDREVAEQTCFEVGRTKAFSWLSEIHQRISTNRPLRFRNRVSSFRSASPSVSDWRRPDEFTTDRL